MLESLKLELLVVMSHPVWVLGTKLGPLIHLYSHLFYFQRLIWLGTSHSAAGSPLSFSTVTISCQSPLASKISSKMSTVRKTAKN